MPVAFAGSAQELRQRSRRDLLINLVLGGLYTSVARQHRAHYLASRTTIDGTPVVQVPVSKSRWPAVVVVLVFVALRVANEFGDGPPLPLMVIVGVLLVPYLWATVTTRSFAAMRWRETPLSFDARWGEIYAASWPLLVLGIAWACLQPAVAQLAESDSIDIRIAWAALAAAVVAFPMLAAFSFNLRRLRFTRTRVGQWPVTWPARYRDYLRLWILTALGVLATAIAPVLLLRHALFGAFTMQEDGRTLAIYAVSLTAIVLLSIPARAWYEARLFALTWNGVQVGDVATVQCTLDARAFVRMRTADAWRSVRTFGRHHAQAVVNAYVVKLAALQVQAE